MHDENMGRKIASIAVAGSAAALLVASMSGCVQSDTITEKVIDNKKTSQVDKSIQPQLINDINAKKTTTELPQLVNDPKSKTSNKTSKKVPVYTSNKKKAKTNKPAPRPKYKVSAQNSGQASKTAAKDNKAKTEQKHGQTTKKKNKKNGVKKQRSKTGKKDKQTKTKKKTGGQGTKKSTTKAGKGDGTGATFTNDIDQDPKIPSNIDEVAAVGNNAVIVSMVAGSSDKTPLKACDTNTKKQASKVLAKKGISKVTALWSGDGSSSGSLSDANMKKLLQKGTIPDLVFVTENSGTLSKAQIKTLKKHKVDVYYLPELTSAKRIRYAVRVVGMILDKGGVSGAKSNYQQYLSWESDKVSSYSNGKFAGGYNFDEDKSADDVSDPQVTLFIDDWDKSARYKQSGVSSSGGVALSTVGYQAAPISYYLSAGGALNNAASKTFRRAQDGAEGIVWQFNNTTASSAPSEWSNLSATDYDLTNDLSSSNFKNNLLFYSDSDTDGFGYGTSSFNTVITKSKEIRKLFNSSVKAGKGLYHAYSSSDGTPGSTIGGHRVSACIGYDGKSAVSNASSNMKVLVNPKGLAQSSASDQLCSWTDGSVESVLETSWANYQFNGGSKDAFESDVKDFYSTFYDYDLSDDDLSKIESGVSK